MKFLLLNQFYPPDLAPTGRLLHDVASGLVNRGHDVSVFCSQRSYAGGGRYAASETMNGVQIRRVRSLGFGRRTFIGKLLDYTSFAMALSARLMVTRTTSDLVLSLTTPPYIGLLARKFSGKRAGRHAHWILDLYPDAMAAYGMLRTGSVAFGLLQKLTRSALARNVVIIAPGPEIAARLCPYCDRFAGGQDNSCCRSAGEWQNAAAKSTLRDHAELQQTTCVGELGACPVRTQVLWADQSLGPRSPESSMLLRQERGWGPDELVLLYSGNMGLGHRFADFLETARRPVPGTLATGAGQATGAVRWVFAGGGRRRVEIEEFKRRNPQLPIDILPYVPWDGLCEHLNAADVHLVSLEPSWEGCMIPSKIQSSFAVGKPVIYVGDPEGTVGRWIRDSRAGWLVVPGDVDALLKAVDEARDADERQRRGTNAAAYAREHFAPANNCAAMCDLLESACRSRLSS